MATNTRLLGRRSGAVGKAVSVIAVAIDVYAGRLGQAMVGLAAPVDTLSVASSAIRDARSDRQEDQAGQLLATALATIRQGCQRSEQGVGKGGTTPISSSTRLQVACDELSRELAVATVMEDVALALSPSAEPVDLPDDALDAVRGAPSGMGALYTMASERTVHARFLLPGMESAAPSPATAPASDDDLFDEALS